MTAKYLALESGTLAPTQQPFIASPAQPAVIEVPDDYIPSSRWRPMNKAAAAALEKLGKARKVPVDTEIVGLDDAKEDAKDAARAAKAAKGDKGGKAEAADGGRASDSPVL